MEKLYPKSKGPETGSPFFGKRTASIPGTVVSNHSHELPSLESLRDNCVKLGHLKKLCGRGILSPGTWKDRYGLLHEKQLYLYENQDGEGKEKGIGVLIDLSHYDIVTEAPTRVTRKAANVFFLGTSDKRFFDSSGRHYFATENEAEMKSWVSALQSSMETSRGGSNGASSPSIVATEHGAQSGESTRRKNKKNATTASSTSLKTSEPKMRSSVAMPKESMDEGSEIILGGTLPRSGGQLDCAVAKGRAKGPPGRRLPRTTPIKSPPQTHLLPSSMETLETGGSPAPAAFRDTRGRATSLSALEHNNYAGLDENRGASNRSTICTPPSPREVSTNPSPSELSTNPTNPKRDSSGSFDFERAWFLKVPSKNRRSCSGEEMTSDYSSLHEDLSEGSSSQSSSLVGTPSPRHPKTGQDGDKRSSPSPRPQSSISKRYFCAIL